MKAAAMTDADYSSADTMELPPKNAEVMQATAEEKAWARWVGRLLWTLFFQWWKAVGVEDAVNSWSWHQGIIEEE